MITKTLVFGVAVVAVSYLYSRWKISDVQSLDELEQSIIESWNSSITEPLRKFSRISVGINCDLDLIVSGTELLRALGQKPGKSLDSVVVQNLEDLTNTFTYYFKKGSAAERTFTDKETYRLVIEKAEGLSSKEHYIGGNAALMAVKVAELFPQKKVQLIGPIGPKLKLLLPPSIVIPEDSLIPSDEVHLIMEYGRGEVWETISSPVANRFITSHDESNSKLTMLDKFFRELNTFNPDLVLLSGLHLLDNQNRGFIVDKLDAVKEGLKVIKPEIPVHLELASMANKDVVQLILEKIIPEVTSLGLNEQELSFSAHVAGGPHSDDFYSRSGQPEIHKVGDMILWLLKNYGYSKTNPTSKLTRVHFHSLTFHMVGSLPGAWHNTESSVAAGTRMAGRQACDVKKLSPPDIELRIPKTIRLFTGDREHNFDENKPVISCNKGGFHFVFSPVLVCIEPLKTVGLGDAISATGLLYSEFDISYRK